MDKIVYFFRDTLSGPIYIVYVIICVILIFACIGYLAEKSINKKKEKEKYQEAKVIESGNEIGEIVNENIASEKPSNPSSQVVAENLPKLESQPSVSELVQSNPQIVQNPTPSTVPVVNQNSPVSSNNTMPSQALKAAVPEIVSQPEPSVSSVSPISSVPEVATPVVSVAKENTVTMPVVESNVSNQQPK